MDVEEPSRSFNGLRKNDLIMVVQEELQDMIRIQEVAIEVVIEEEEEVTEGIEEEVEKPQ